MADALKDSFAEDVPQTIGEMIKKVDSSFNVNRFVQSSLVGFKEASLTGRAALIADALFESLPQPYARAIDVLIHSLGPKLSGDEDLGMAPFLYMPHVIFVQKYGLNDFEDSMRAQYELTQRFTAEFSIRAFLTKYPEQTLAQLKQWTQDASPHVRRLVSEGTRPRLPWAQRLPMFQEDPKPVIQLLDDLKDDVSLYVRRSVANNLNDISKDNPADVAKVVRRWQKKKTPERAWLINHALRSAIKRSEPWALDALGYSETPNVEITSITVSDNVLRIGDKLKLSFSLKNVSKKSARLLVDFQIHYVKANGSVRAKVFKLSAKELASGISQTYRKTISFADMTTRKHYAGKHCIDVIVNGVVFPIGSVEVE